MSQRQDDDSQCSDDSSSPTKHRHNPKIPRFIKHTLDNVNLSQITLNTHRSQYQILDQIAHQLNWSSEKQSKSQIWDILWTDSEIDSNDFFKMHEYQKVSHFPGINVLARKNQLGKALMKLRKEFGEEYGFFPLTWSLPAEYNQLLVFANGEGEEGEGNKKKIFIVKPEASCQGKGIFLTKSVKELEGCTYVVQEYLQNPLLINKLKFDFRMYVLLLGCDPLRIYVYQQGLARFATQPYKTAKLKNLKSTCIHLTNYSLNKKNPNFVFNTSQEKMNVGHKRSLSSIFTHLESININTKQIKSKINDMIIKTLISAQPFLSHLYRLSQPNNLQNNMCFQILGFDIILDSSYKPYLLQVNHNPSLITDTPLDKFIKKKLVKDTLKLLNVNVKGKEEKVMKKRKEMVERGNGVRSRKMEVGEKMGRRREEQGRRDQYEDGNLGGYVRVYPVREEGGQWERYQWKDQYEKFLEKSEDLWKQISGIKHNFQNESLSLNPLHKTLRKYKTKSSKKSSPNPPIANISLHISSKKSSSLKTKTTPKKLLFSSDIDLSPTKLLMANDKLFKFPVIEKGKFVTPQTFCIRDWGVESESRVPVYLKDFMGQMGLEGERRREGRREKDEREGSVRKRM